MVLFDLTATLLLQAPPWVSLFQLMYHFLPRCGSTDDRIDDPLGNCPYFEEYAHLCGIITSSTGPFGACHLHSDPEPFFTSCVYDLCLYSQANGMLCSAVSAYEDTCSVLGVDIPEWRSDLHCGTFALK